RARSQVGDDCDVRALRLRQLQLHRHPDRRHRRAGAEPPSRSGAARPARDVRGDAGKLHDRNDCGVLAIATKTRTHQSEMSYYDDVKEAADLIRARVRELPETAVVLGSGLGDFAGTLGD